MLGKSKEIKIRLDPNFKKRVLISYNPNAELPEGLTEIKDTISKKEDVDFGILDEEKKELAQTMPKKFSYMK